MAGVCLCGFIGPYKIQGSRETHIQWDWEGHIQWVWPLACLSESYTSNSGSCVAVPGFPLLPVEQGGS